MIAVSYVSEGKHALTHLRTLSIKISAPMALRQLKGRPKKTQNRYKDLIYKHYPPYLEFSKRVKGGGRSTCEKALYKAIRSEVIRRYRYVKKPTKCGLFASLQSLL